MHSRAGDQITLNLQDFRKVLVVDLPARDLAQGQEFSARSLRGRDHRRRGILHAVVAPRDMRFLDRDHGLSQRLAREATLTRRRQLYDRRREELSLDEVERIGS
jgi:hypothetical protein